MAECAHSPSSRSSRSRAPPKPGDSEFLHKAYATIADAKLADGRVESFSIHAPFWTWIEESRALTEQAYDVGRGRLRGRYFRRNIGTVHQRVGRAGRRLAATLDRIFGVSEDPARKAEIERSHRELRERLVGLIGDQTPLVRLAQPGALAPAAP